MASAGAFFMGSLSVAHGCYMLLIAHCSLCVAYVRTLLIAHYVLLMFDVCGPMLIMYVFLMYALICSVLLTTH